MKAFFYWICWIPRWREAQRSKGELKSKSIRYVGGKEREGSRGGKKGLWAILLHHFHFNSRHLALIAPFRGDQFDKKDPV